MPEHTQRSGPPRSRANQQRAGRPRTDPARRAAYDVLRAVEDRDAYANLLLPALLSERGLTGRDAALATELTYGTLRGRGTYDAILAACSDRDELDPPVRDVLRLGAHQLLATRVGSHAAVATSVDLAKDVCGPRPSGFVNAVLRRVATRDLDAWIQVIAPDQRGRGLTSKPVGGYDTGTLAGDLVALMDALGHERFAVAGHDTGMWIGYALAADHPDRVARLTVAETPLPGVSPSPPLFANAHLNNALWHFAFNRLAAVNDQLVTGREEIYFGWQFATKAARPLPEYGVRHYIDTLAAGPDALHASFAIYRALDATIAQNQQRQTRRLRMPVLGIGGGKSLGEQVAATMKLAADDVQALVIPGCGHHPPEEAPEETLAALTAFLAPYRDEQAAAHNPGPQATPV